MANPQRIGLYLTDDNIVLAEANPKGLLKVASSAVTTSLSPSTETSFQSDMAEEIHIVGTLQRLLRENKMEPGPISISIPIKDVFLRSFVVPWMPAGELGNVVFYEAKKYVPFDLKLLDYVYQAVPFFENKQKRLRIIFYAVRKQTIEKYDRILKQTGCKPVVYEPSLFSLAKYLINKNLLRPDQKTVVVYTHQDYGQIIFYEKGVSYFVREFSLSVTDVHDPKAVADVLRAQLMREIRKSLGYYSRQFSQDKIKEVLVLSAVTDNELTKILSEEISAKVRTAEPAVMAGLQTILGMDNMCACGAAMVKAPAGFSAFNFLLAKSTQTQDSSKKFLPGFVGQLLSWKIGDFVYALQAAVVGGVLLGVGFFYGQIRLQSLQREGEALTLRQGELANKTIDEINAIIKRNDLQLKLYQSILNDKSHIAPILIDIAKVLPQGVWLDSFNVRYHTDSFLIDLKGYVYTPDETAQFKLVNEFLSRIKNSQYLTSVKFKLNTIQKIKMNDRQVSYFSITGS
jgi:Tfp pilus assembly PilM family ATPase/Tfp pilus assembly protein PilN